MIEISHILNKQALPHVIQTRTSPSIYLDTCAIRKLSADISLGNRFIERLSLSNGTLVLSELMYFEIGTMEDPRHARDAEIFMDRMLPNIFFIRFDPFKVLERENDNLQSGIRDAPEGDGELLLKFCEAQALRGGVTSFRGTFMGVHARRLEFRDRLIGVAQALIAGIEGLRSRIETEPEVRAEFVNGIARAKRIRSTLAILRALISDLVKARTTALKRNDAIDVLHAVVPASCCTHVVLDKGWAPRLQATVKRMRKAGLSSEVAECTRVADLERFIERLGTESL